ncbi:MAG: acetate--CoA ligase family protein [Proteobacteria bacterium]|nr:acetate--CoA ligase family protein [Pseudomonadota bacterium]MBU1585715.1 acetate--CoA ligase family protein [Pseudomonadota bacterium]MBU2455276.1 acetate--CoA ligase family protein [Pseudomonadota bacterium]MBU2629930.1 acetate--CoA ligase family protein [Pseudomonadota bacterium]
MKLTDIQELINKRLLSPSKSMVEDEAKKIFKLFHIPVVKEIRESDESLILAACRKTGFPVVLKGMGKTILHKTESGLVRVGLNTEAQVLDAVKEMKISAKERVEAFLIQPVVAGKREFVAGMFKDPQFGPVILFGLGGILTEVLNDVVFKIAPLNDADMEDMFEQLSSKTLLNDFRGEKKADKEIIKIILKGLSDIALAYPDIKEIDINPLIIQPDGSPVAVDGLIVLEAVKEKEQIGYKIDLNVLGSCYYPKSIAFIGASATPGKWGHMLLTNTLSREYKGMVYLVNPKGEKITGRRVYTSITEIEEDVELAVVTIPANQVIDLIPGLKKKNVKGVLLITSGFREVGQKGAVLEKELMKAAYEAGILILGPNTMGVCNPHIDFYCCAAHAYPLPGSTALVCQSGNMGTQLLAFAEQQDIGIRAFSGSGNEAMVTIEDYMEAFEIDDLTRTVVLYIESIKDGSRFFKSASRVSTQKPVVVLKGGRTKKGERAASSHTGAMASDSKVFDAACRQAGIIQVDQPMELLDLSAVFSSLPLPKGNRVAIMTLGGGWGVITTDLCAEHGLEVPELSQDIIERLNRILPPFWSHGNPVDIVGEGDPNIPKTCLEELLKWDGCDAVIHLGIHGKRVLVNSMLESVCKTDPDIDRAKAELFKDTILKFEEEYTQYVIKLTQKYEKPVLGVSLLTDEISRTLYRLEGYEYKSVFFPSPERAVKALWGMCQYNDWRKSHSKGAL